MSIQIGKYILERRTDNTVWITIANDGEGGSFNEEELEKAIEQFYTENF